VGASDKPEHSPRVPSHEDTSAPEGPAPVSQAPDPDEATKIARRKLLQTAHYVAPAILATVVVDLKRAGVGSCGPSECHPFGCKPVR